MVKWVKSGITFAGILALIGLIADLTGIFGYATTRFANSQNATVSPMPASQFPTPTSKIVYSPLPTVSGAPVMAMGSRIFRYIDIGLYGKIYLGTYFMAQDVSEPTGETVYRLRRGSFDGAETILFEVTKDNIIKAMYFDYPLGTSYETKVAIYSSDLGVPSGHSTPEPGTKVTFWEDTETRFEVIERTKARITTVHSALFDRSLNP